MPRQSSRSTSARRTPGDGQRVALGCLVAFGLCLGIAVVSGIVSNFTHTTGTPTAFTIATSTPAPTETDTPQPTATPKLTAAQVNATATATFCSYFLQPPPGCLGTGSGVNGNPWGYDFNSGNLIYSPPGAFCNYFPCIASFWNGSGYVVECQDGDYSKSGGIQGVCSQHGGYQRTLYSH